LVADQMALLRRAGVDTVYVERDKKWNDEYQQLSDDEIRSLMATRVLADKNISIFSAKEVAQTYGKQQADDTWFQWMRMELAARREGIRVVGIDSDRPAAGIIPALRVDSTNPVWTDNIERDRVNLRSAGAPEGKFIVIGGQGHFSNDPSGYVDEALGVPYLAFDPDVKTPEGFNRGRTKLGADFYLSADASYYPNQRLEMIETIQSATQSVRNFALNSSTQVLSKNWNQKTIAAVHHLGIAVYNYSNHADEMLGRVAANIHDTYDNQSLTPSAATATTIETPKTPTSLPQKSPSGLAK
ncbi:MAG: hypothetical protein ACK5XN_14590, partial [Bacteroidota bacterium]